MSLKTAERAIRQEIDRLQAQANQLETALSHLNGGATQQRRRRDVQSTVSKARHGRRTTKRIPATERQEQVLAVIKKRPGIRPGELAREVGVTPAYISGLV